MIIDLSLQHFRSYTDDSFEFSGGVNIVVGPNASGKTNLLESILVLARGGSYRTGDAELVQFGADWARLDARLDDDGQRTFKLAVRPAVSKSYEIDGKAYRRLTLNHTLPLVLFEPNHLQLLSGGPDLRRTYLDDLLEQTRPEFGVIRRQYRRTLAQRNRLLKQTDGALQGQIFPWNIRLSQLAGQVVRARSVLVEEIRAALPGLYADLSHSGTAVAALYGARWPVEGYETWLLKKLEDSLELDQLRGFTAYGPHREDLLVTFDDRPVQETASRGEVRTATLALKIIELRLMQAARGQAPLLLLDDVFSELDGRRRHALTDYLAPYQTFITTTDADVVLQHFTKNCNVIPLGA